MRLLKRLLLVLVLAVIAAAAGVYIHWNWKRPLSPAGGRYYSTRLELPVPSFRQGDERWREDPLGGVPENGTLALFCFIVTLQNIPLATAVTIAYLSPIFTTLVGVFLLGEHVRRSQWCFYAIAFAGVLVIKGFDASVPTLFLFTGIVSAVCSAVAYNLVRRLKEHEHPLVVVLHFQLVGVAAGLVFTLFNWTAPAGPWEWFCLLMCGLLTQIGQTCLTKSLQAERVAHVAILNYTGLIYALAFGVFIFGEHYPLQTILGIALVVVGVVLSVGYGKRKQLEVIEESELAE